MSRMPLHVALCRPIIVETFISTEICLPIRGFVSARRKVSVINVARVGFAFEPGRWDGEPVNAEPHKHSWLVWADPAALPPDTVGYAAAVLTAVERGLTFTLNGW